MKCNFLIFLFITCIGCFFYFSSGLNLYPDSHGYLDLALCFLNQGGSCETIRMPLYSYAISLFHFGDKIDLNALTSFQMLLSILCVFTAYLSLDEVISSLRRFILVGLIVLAMVPFAFQKTILTEGIFIPLSVIYFSHYKKIGCSRWYTQLFFTLLCIALVSLREAFLPIFLASFGIALIQYRKRILLPLIIFLPSLGVILIISILHKNKVNYSGKLLFYTQYLARGIDNKNIKPSYLDTAELFNLKTKLIEQLSTSRGQKLEHLIFQRKVNLDEIFENPSRTGLSLIWNLGEQENKEYIKDATYLKASVSLIKKDLPGFFQAFFLHFKSLAKGITGKYQDDKNGHLRLVTSRSSVYPLYREVNVKPLSQEFNYKSLASSISSDFKSKLFFYHTVIWSPVFCYLKPFIFLLMLISVFFYKGAERFFIFNGICMVIIHLTLVSFFNEPLMRYNYHTFTIELILSYLGLLGLLDLFRLKWSVFFKKNIG